jgi:phage FluMu protein Com
MKMKVIFIFANPIKRCLLETPMKPQRDELPSDRTAVPAGDCRCLCGSLLARVVAGGVELKCRRCKRTLLVPLEPAMATEVARAPAAVRPIETLPVRRTG